MLCCVWKRQRITNKIRAKSGCTGVTTLDQLSVHTCLDCLVALIRLHFCHPLPSSLPRWSYTRIFRALATAPATSFHNTRKLPFIRGLFRVMLAYPVLSCLLSLAHSCFRGHFLPTQPSGGLFVFSLP